MNSLNAAPMLAGLRVIEGSAFVAAPSGGMHLAQLGADVIRFDQIGGGIDFHRWPLSAGGRSLYWTALNKGKRSVAVNLRSDEGRELVKSLVAAPGENGGMFLSNFPNRGWMAYDELRKGRDDLIMMSVMGNPDGSTALDYTVNAAVGFPAVTGLDAEGARPTNHVLPAWDLLCGQQAVIGLLAAERHRRMTGAGQLVTLSLTDVGLAAVANLGYIAEVQINKTQRARLGNDLYGAFGRDFATSDGRRFIVVAISIKQWTGLVEAVDMEAEMTALAAEVGADLANEGDRFDHRDRIFAVVEAWAASRTLSEVQEIFDARGVCWGPYQDFHQLVDEDRRCSPENPMFETIDQPGIGSVLAPGSPLSFGVQDRPAVQPAPELGEHTEEVLVELLGLSARELGSMFDSGLIAASGSTD